MHINQDSAGNESEFFGIMTTISDLPIIQLIYALRLVMSFGQKVIRETEISNAYIDHIVAIYIIMNFFNSILPTIDSLGIFGYWVLLLTSLAESLPFIGLIVPGTILLGFFGFLSAQGYLDIGDLIWFATIGAILGDSISYYLGTKGTRFFSDENTILKQSYLQKGEKFFKKYGNKSIFLGRFIGPLRPIVPFIAGLSSMDKKIFVFWNVISAVLWSVTFLFLGYFFGSALPIIGVWSTRAGIFLVLLFLSTVLIRIIVRKSKQFFILLGSITLSVQEAIITNPDVKKFINKHLSFFKFLQKRFDKKKFTGLPLTFLGISFVYIFSLALGIIEDIITSDQIVFVDVRVANLLPVFRNALLIKTFFWITLLGNWQIVVVFAVIASCIFIIWKKKSYVLSLWITLAGSELFVFLGKLAFRRPRPDVAVYTENSFSFPSGHAAIAAAFYGFITYILFRSATLWRSKINILFFGLIIIFAIGFSRLYLGVHFLSDVWGGYLLGLLWLIIGVSIFEWFQYNKKSSPQNPSKNTKLITRFFIVFGLVFYIFYAKNHQPLFRARDEATNKIVVDDVLGAFNKNQLPDQTRFQLGSAVFQVEVAQTQEERSRGLSGRAGMKDNQGMLFVFDQAAFQNFWMKDMKFPIDIIWMDGGFQVVDITRNLSPQTYPKTFTSLSPAKYVLEINAGLSEKNNILLGDFGEILQ